MSKTIGNRPQHEEYPYDIFSEGDRCRIRGYSDVCPGTVMAVKRNGSEVHVRHDNFKLDPEGPKPEFIPGGFAAHCTNQRQLKYLITEATHDSVEVFTLRKWRGRYVWTPKGCEPDGKQCLAQGWHAFYDYNF